jgi:hypothetical protein
MLIPLCPHPTLSDRGAHAGALADFSKYWQNIERLH